MQVKNRIVMLAAVIALLAGCSLGRRQVDYQAGAVQAPPLEVPPDLTTPETEQRYVIPGTDGQQAVNYSDYYRAREEPCANPAPVASNAEAGGARFSAQLQETPTGKRILLPEAFDRGWRKVGLALERAGISVSDRDRSKGIYFVKTRRQEYQVRVGETREGSEVSVTDATGGQDAETVRLIELVFHHLEEQASPVQSVHSE